MAIAPRNSRRSSIDIWPGFVDALSQLLMVIIFILLLFTAGQFYLGTALSGRDQALQKLQHQVDELANLLALERQSSEELRSGTAALSSQLQGAVAERDQHERAEELGQQLAVQAGDRPDGAALAAQWSDISHGYPLRPPARAARGRAPGLNVRPGGALDNESSE